MPPIGKGVAKRIMLLKHILQEPIKNCKKKVRLVVERFQLLRTDSWNSRCSELATCVSGIHIAENSKFNDAEVPLTFLS